MKLENKALTRAVRMALVLGAASLAPAGVAFAQSAAPAPATSSGQSNPQQMQTVTVTGSHIRRVDLETSNPVVTVDRAQIKASGDLTLGQLVQDLPAVTGGVVNPQVNNAGGTGGSSIGLRGLGSQRTLVLIDGHRIINQDPNSIPADMIERVEVLTTGASAVYGSDAIGGVVNFITRKNYQGAQFTTQYGVSSRGDGRSKGYSFTFGQTSDKGSIMGGVDYNKQDQILASQRKFSENALSIYGSPNTPLYTFVGGSSFPPHGNIQLPDNLAAQYGCGRVAANAGASGQNTSTDYHCFGNSDKYNYASVNLDMTPQERTSGWLSGTYNLSDNVSTFLSFYHDKTSSGFQLAPSLLGTLYGAEISADSYYNPFGQPFSSSAANGLDYRARLVSAGNRAAAYGTSTDQVNAGFKGDFGFFGNDWNWTVGLNYGHISQSLVTKGLPNVTQLNKDLGPSFMNSSGQVECGTPDNPIPNGCTPFNPFNLFAPNSVAVLQGAATPAISHNTNIEKVYYANANGGLFDLPAGTAQLALGVSYRKEYSNDKVDPVLTIDPSTGNCTLGSQCSSPLQGGYNVKEGYAELFLPLLSNMPGIYSLNVTLGDRYSKYSTFGSTNNTKFAVEWRPIQDLLLRGTVAKVFRAPTVNDIYGAPISDAPKLSSDPCDGYTGGGNPACVNVPTDGSFQNTDVALGQQIKGVAAGSQYANFPLGPEQGKTFDLGAVYSPGWAPGLSGSVDFWKVYLNDTITSIGAQQVLNLCSAGVTSYCPLISRNGPSSAAPGQINQIIEPTGNLGRIDVSGIDTQLRYRLPQFSFGQFVAGINATYLSKYDQNTAPGIQGDSVYYNAGHFQPFGSPQAASCPSGGGVCLYPRWRGKAFVTWAYGDWHASWHARYIGAFQNGSKAPSQDTFPAYSALNGVVFKYGATVYNDFQAGYTFAPLNTTLDLGVKNAFDKQPPMLYANNTLNANTDPSDFDLIGRYYYARVTVKF